MTLKIGTLEIPEVAGHSWRQSYREIGTGFPFRTRNGGLIAHQRYRKLQSSISGEGWDVAGLEGLNPATAYALHCIQPRAISSASNVITIPNACRTDGDYAVQGAAVVAGEIVPSTVSLASQVATVGTVSGASAYIVKYYPILTGFLTVTTDFDDDNQLYNISIEFNEQ